MARILVVDDGRTSYALSLFLKAEGHDARGGEPRRRHEVSSYDPSSWFST